MVFGLKRQGVYIRRYINCTFLFDSKKYILVNYGYFSSLLYTSLLKTVYMMRLYDDDNKIWF